VPSAEAVGLLDWFLTALADRGVPVVLISGNHDSAERLAFGAQLLVARGVHISPPLDAAHAAVTPLRLHDAFGTVALWPLPFLKPAHVRALYPEANIETLTDAVAVMLDVLPLSPDERNVLLCHQYLTGGERTESEEEPIGGLDGVDAALFDRFDYVALGHLHRAQRIRRDTVRYAGSPLKYSFSEANDKKSATLVTLGAKGDVTVQLLPLAPLRDVRELRGSYAWLTLRQNYLGTAVDDYLRITLTDEDDVPDAMAKLQVIYPNLLNLIYDNARTRAGYGDAPADADSPRTPPDLLSGFYELQNNRPLNDAQRAYALPLMQKLWEGRL
jgi:exonuclease SbcD